jgi:hypothetical protein
MLPRCPKYWWLQRGHLKSVNERQAIAAKNAHTKKITSEVTTLPPGKIHIRMTAGSSAARANLKRRHLARRSSRLDIGPSTEFTARSSVVVRIENATE